MVTNTNLFETILVGVDDSDPSNFAVSYAARLARDHASRLLLCNAINVLSVVSSSPPIEIVDMDGIRADLREAGTTLLERAAALCSSFGVAAERLLPEGTPTEAVLAVAERHGATVIVLGTHGRDGLARMFLGSTTEAILRASTIPVLTLHSPAAVGRESDRCIERILLGIDESDPSTAALEVVLGMSAEDRRDVVVCRVVDEAVQSTNEASLHEVIDRSVTASGLQDVAIHERIRVGKPEHVLIRTAEEEHADLIVVGSHGRRGLRHLILGSVAEHLVRAAPVPMLVVRTSSVVPAVA